MATQSFHVHSKTWKDTRPTASVTLPQKENSECEQDVQDPIHYLTCKVEEPPHHTVPVLYSKSQSRKGEKDQTDSDSPALAERNFVLYSNQMVLLINFIKERGTRESSFEHCTSSHW